MVSSESFVAANVAAGEDSPTKEAIDCVVFVLMRLKILLMPCLGAVDHQSLLTSSLLFLNLYFFSLHLHILSATPESFFILALSHRHICNVLAKFAYDTLQVFEQKEMFVVDSALYLNAVALPTVTSSIPSNSML